MRRSRLGRGRWTARATERDRGSRSWGCGSRSARRMLDDGRADSGAILTSRVPLRPGTGRPPPVRAPRRHRARTLGHRLQVRARRSPRNGRSPNTMLGPIRPGDDSRAAARDREPSTDARPPIRARSRTADKCLPSLDAQGERVARSRLDAELGPTSIACETLPGTLGSEPIRHPSTPPNGRLRMRLRPRGTLHLLTGADPIFELTDHDVFGCSRCRRGVVTAARPHDRIRVAKGWPRPGCTGAVRRRHCDGARCAAARGHATRPQASRRRPTVPMRKWLRELLCEGRLPESWCPPEHVAPVALPCAAA